MVAAGEVPSVVADGDVVVVEPVGVTDGVVAVGAVLTSGADDPDEDELPDAGVDTRAAAAAGRSTAGTVSITARGAMTAMVVSVVANKVAGATVVVGTVMVGITTGVGAFSHTDRGVAEPRFGKSVSLIAHAAPTATRPVPRVIASRLM